MAGSLNDREDDQFAVRLEMVSSKLADLHAGDFLLLGAIEADLNQHIPGIVTFEAIITGNRREHYLGKHPEVLPFERLVILAVLRPDEIHIDRTRTNTFNHYVAIDEHHDVRVALRYSITADKKHSVITAMVTRKRDRRSSERNGRLVWRR